MIATSFPEFMGLMTGWARRSKSSTVRGVQTC